jgi:hypothetical protein
MKLTNSTLVAVPPGLGARLAVADSVLSGCTVLLEFTPTSWGGGGEAGVVEEA